MKQLGIAMVLTLGVLLAACGGGTSNTAPTVTGNWSATLTNADTTPAFSFTTSLTQGSATTVVTGTNLSFNSTNCFTSGGTETGSFVLNGNMTGAFQSTIVSGTPPGNTLTLTGKVNNTTIAGTWILTGTCSGSGNFTMTKS